LGRGIAAENEQAQADDDREPSKSKKSWWHCLSAALPCGWAYDSPLLAPSFLSPAKAGCPFFLPHDPSTKVLG